MKKYALIVAGGSGSRMQRNVPKQFLLLGGKPLLMYSLHAFYTYNHEIELVLVLPEDQIAYWNGLCERYSFTINHNVVAGGDTRFDSVKKGLQRIKEDGYVAIHDGVRPLVSQDTIKTCFRTAEKFGNALPVIDVPDSVRFTDHRGSKPLMRDRIKISQTPQVFKVHQIRKAYDQPYDPGFTDDSVVLESMGYKIHLTPGNTENIKITTQMDLIIAEALLKQIKK